MINDGDMTSLDLAVDTCLDQDQREESLPTEHSELIVVLFFTYTILYLTFCTLTNDLFSVY